MNRTITLRRTSFDCRRCGHCCLHLVDAYRGCVSDGDLALWQAAGRDDLLAWIDTLDLGHGNLLHLAWIDPQSKEEVDRCPWLREIPDGYGCAIYEHRPQYCRDYPENVKHAQGSGCPGYFKKPD
jgi:Fe-S-cluster containining protein